MKFDEPYQKVTSMSSVATPGVQEKGRERTSAAVGEGLAPAPGLRWPPFVTRLGAGLASWLRENQLVLGEVITLVATLRIALGIVGFLAMSFLPTNPIPLVVHPSADPSVDMWARWDSIHYLTIAEYGYTQSPENVAFFPLYPFLIRVLRSIPLFNGDMVIWGLLISTLSYVVALFYLHKLVTLEFDADLASRTVFYVAIAPMAFFFLSLYTEPLFLAFTVGAIYHARKSQWTAASFLGVLAVLTRPPGLLLVVPLGYEALSQWWATRNDTGLKGLLPAFQIGALPAALVAWMGYLYKITGDPLAFVHVQAAQPWNRTSDFPLHTLYDAVRSLIAQTPMTYSFAQYSVDLVSALLVIAAIVVAFFYLPRTYAFYLAASGIFLLTSRSNYQVLFSFPRFALVLFPVFMLLAMVGRNAKVHQGIMVTFLTLLGLYTAMFVTWYWIA